MKIIESIGACLNETVQTIVEKNRIKAQINRLRLVMRSEAKSINRAYIELGKEYYKKIKNDEASASDEAENYCSAIVKSTDRFNRAVARYHDLVDKRVIDMVQDDIEAEEECDGDITLCCSYEEDSPIIDNLEADSADNCDCKESEEVSSDDDLQSVKDKIDEMIDITGKSDSTEE